jgi:hypothetical protein
MAPVVSFTAPRSEVLEVWAEARVAIERMQQSIHPHWDFFTATPPKENAEMRLRRVRHSVWFFS